jgi:hypothetical protein
MTQGADDKIRAAIKKLGSDPDALGTLLSHSGEERREKLREMGLDGISRDDVAEFIEQDEVSGFALRQTRPGSKTGGGLHSTVEWTSTIATLAAGALAA